MKRRCRACDGRGVIVDNGEPRPWDETHQRYYRVITAPRHCVRCDGNGIEPDDATG